MKRSHMRQLVLPLASNRGAGKNTSSGRGGITPLKFTLTLILVALTCVSLVAATDVSSQVRIAHTGFGRNRATGARRATMTATNQRAAAISGPLPVVSTGLPAEVTMVNNTGLNKGRPYRTASAGVLAPGASASVSIRFTNLSNAFINFTQVTYSGDLS